MSTQIPSYVWLLSIIISQFMSTNLANSDTYIAHMDLSAMPTVFSSHHSWYMAILASSSESDFSTNSNNTSSTTSPAKLIYVYTNAIHGFSASLTPSQFKTITNSLGYVSSTQDSLVKLTTTRSSKFLGLNPNHGAWPLSSYGKDVIIGLVDSGVWPESKSFDDSGMTEIPSRRKGKCKSGTQFNSSMCNKKLIGARYFNKGLLAKNPNLTISMNSAHDTNGHGTHTSSTAAGNYVRGASYFGYATGTARGMAPRARVAMYKSFWKHDVGYFTDILAALDQAIIDGVDILSLSIGSGPDTPLYEDPTAIASFAALEKGIFVATAAGNMGPYLASLRNEAPWVLIVAAGTIDREFMAKVTLGNGVSIMGLSLYSGNSSLIQSRSLAFMDNGSCQNETELKKIGPKIVICKDQNDTIVDQFYKAEDSIVAGGVFITHTDIDFDHFSITFPAVFLNPQNGEIVLEYIKSCRHDHEPKAIVEFQETRLGTKPAPRVSSFSARGPSKSCPFVLKPDLMAPGEMILASWPENVQLAFTSSGHPIFNNFNLMSGTSMSCPHAAGVAALVKGIHPEWSPAAIRSAMMTTSDVLDNTLNPIQDKGYNSTQPAIALAMGAGHINPNKALDPGLMYDLKSQDYVSLLCALNFTMKQIQTITQSASYSCANPSMDLNYPSFIAFFTNDSSDSKVKTVQEFQRTVTHVGDGISTYIAKLTPLDGFQVSVMPDKLDFKDMYEKKSYKLRIEGPTLMKDVAVYGSLSWVEFGGKRVVRSPIVATSLSSETLMRGPN